MSLFERQAPELRVQRWIGEDGGISVAPLKLSDLGTGPKILFAFQHWCRGCHAHGFPTLQRLHGALSSKGVGFAVIQTVFEGAHENTFDKLRVNQLKYELPVPYCPSRVNLYRTRRRRPYAAHPHSASIVG